MFSQKSVLALSLVLLVFTASSVTGVAVSQTGTALNHRRTLKDGDFSFTGDFATGDLAKDFSLDLASSDSPITGGLTADLDATVGGGDIDIEKALSVDLP
ncbi:hypothetical protein WJX73_007683 [Symbiochloris irregularis]|uniref:Uncharacterized protein n=1 Tax=Symbiochloris irregularis TaxID=706552 RepID=A0AAW1NMN4_9CHLO